MPTVELTAGTIHYESSGRPNARPLVCVHGYAMSASLWHPLGELTMEGIASIVAVARPERLGALVLTGCDAFEHFPPPALKPFITAARVGRPGFAMALAPLQTRFGRRRAYGALANADLDELSRDWLACPLSDRRIRNDLRRFTASLVPETMIRAAARLPQFDRPVLVAWAADDAIFPLEDGKRLAATLPNARLEVIPGSRTLSMLDTPARLAALIGEFAGPTGPSR